MSTTTKIQIDTKTFVRFWLVIIGFIAAGYFLFKASFGLSIIFAALFFALAISPLVNKIANIFPSKSRAFAISLSYILVVGFIVAFAAIVVPTILNESIRFFSGLPALFEGTSGSVSLIDKIGSEIGIVNLESQIGQFITSFSDRIVANLGDIITASISSVTSFFAVIILSLVLAFFMLTEGTKLVEDFWKVIGRGAEAKRTHRVLNKLASTVSKYVSSAVTVGLINACCTATAAFIICVIFQISPGLALPFGLITGVFSLIPMFGSFIGGAIVALLLGFNAPLAGVIFLIYTILYLQVEANIISPKIQGKGLRLPALAVLSAVTIGVYTFGLIGAIVSIPIAGCIKVLMDEYGADLIDDGKLNNSTKPGASALKSLASSSNSSASSSASTSSTKTTPKSSH